MQKKPKPRMGIGVNLNIYIYIYIKYIIGCLTLYYTTNS